MEKCVRCKKEKTSNTNKFDLCEKCEEWFNKTKKKVDKEIKELPNILDKT